MAATSAEQALADQSTEPPSRTTLGRTALTGLLLFLVSLGSMTPEGTPTPGDATAARSGPTPPTMTRSSGSTR